MSRRSATLLVFAWVVALFGAAPAADVVGVGAPAPEIGGGAWINSAPLTTAGLRGRVVLVDFWTFG